MVSEKICLEILKLMRGRKATVTQRFHGSDGDEVKTDHADNSVTEGDLYRPMLARYDISDIDAAVRWLKLGAFLSRTEWGLRGPWVHTLTDKACAVADAGSFSEEDRKLLYRVDPYAVFIAHQFNSDDEELVGYIKREVLKPNGFLPGHHCYWNR